jgi:mannose-6-phosphate isomerase-like protein (cupin superfamily)
MYSINEKDKQFIELYQRKWKPLPDESCNTENLLLGITEIKSGNKTPVHKHEDSEEVIYVINGEGKIYFTDFENNIYPGSVTYIPKNKEHSLEATGDGKLKLICIFSPPLQIK